MALNYYRLLGVPPDAGQRRIKSAYRSLAKRFHPDRNHGAETASELFRQVNHAYRILSDAKLRQQYDQKLAQEENSREHAPNATAGSHHLEPQQKFNRFINSLLDALFGKIDDPGLPKSDRTPKTRQTTRKVGKPAFNFHYNLAIEKGKTPYVRGEDGVFRKVSSKNQGR
ncbi:J domain-containing protein [uncultured Desulfuromusa sp.]|uniref:J domain-containing protein n=1 Tax=uncultured Desulfuromusa sp. TaxID=219183 RepID=UPI002AA7C817|nr:J domain-containing protein [uncultured Desulfuromusa sp.]